MKFLRNLLFFLVFGLMFAPTIFGLDIEIRDFDVAKYQWVTVSDVNLTCDGLPIATDVPAMLYEERTMVPVRVVSETLGATVDWVQETQTVVIQNGDTVIQLVIGSPVALVNGVETPLYDNVAPMLVRLDGITRTVVPLRFVSEQLGVTVDWDNDTYTAILTTGLQYTCEVPLPTVEGSLVTIPYTGTATVKTLSLGDRLVVDIGGGLLSGSSFGTIATDNEVVPTIRYNQYDTGMEGLDRVVRLVLDLTALSDDCQVEITDTAVFITVPDAPTPPAEEVPDVDEPDTDEPDVDKPVDPDAPIVVLDAGHGGTEISAIHFGVDEKTLTLPVTLGVGAILEEAGLTVYYTRTEDVKVSLSQRTTFANDKNADIFVSIHFNVFTPKPEINGIETYHIYDGQKSKVLANCVHSSLLNITGAHDRKVKEAGYYVLKNTVMPAILVEGGFMTNKAELDRLVTPEYQALLSQGIAQGILNYFDWE